MLNFHKSWNLTQVDFFVHSIPRTLIKHFEWEILKLFELKNLVEWNEQPIDHLCMKSEFRGSGEHDKVMALISKISKWKKIRMDVYCLNINEQSRFRFSLTPKLGLYRADINDLGETILTESQINSAISRSIEDNLDVKDELSFILGKPWDDELEIFRINFKNQPIKYFSSYGT